MPAYTSNIQVLDGVNDITSMIEFDSSFNIQAALTKSKGSFQFNIKAPKAPTLPTHMPVIGDTIYVNYTINGTKVLIFGGTLVTSEPIVSGGVLLLYQMTAMDWGYALDAFVVKANYAGIDPQTIVEDLISNFAPPGFTTNHVQKGNFNVSTIQFNYQQLSKALQALATQVGWDWYVDPSKDVHFYFAEGNAASSSEISLAPIIIDDTTGDIEWPTLDVQVDITNMKNAVYVVGGTYAKDFVVSPNPNATPPQYAPIDVYTSVAGTFVYPLSYSYSQSTMTITLAGVGQSIGTAQVTDPITVEVLYDDAGRFIQFTSDPGSGHSIVIQGEANVPILAYVTDDASIATYGIREDAISDSKILSVQQAQERAQADIDMFGDPVYIVKFNTISPFTHQLSIGQQITLKSANSAFQISRSSSSRSISSPARQTSSKPKSSVWAQKSSVSTTSCFSSCNRTSEENSTPASTVLQNLIPINESIVIADTVTITGTSGPYVWYPGSGQPAMNFGFSFWQV